MPQLLLELSLEEDPRPHAGERRPRPGARWPASGLAAAGPAARGAEDLLRRAPPDPGGRGPARGRRRTATRTSRARAASAPGPGVRRLPAQDRPAEVRPRSSRDRDLGRPISTRPAASRRAEIVAEMVPTIVIRGLPVAQVDGLGVSKRCAGCARCERILCVFDGEVVPFDIDGIASGDVTEGHRFMGSGQSFKVKDFDAYAREAGEALRRPGPRGAQGPHPRGRQDAVLRRAIWSWSRTEGLLDEVAGLVEWPTPMLGDMDPAFLDLPPEVIRTSMRAHQTLLRGPRPARPASWPPTSSPSPISTPPTAARRSRSATPRCCRPACRTPASSGTRTARPS